MNNDPLSFPSEVLRDGTHLEALETTEVERSSTTEGRTRQAQKRTAHNKKRVELLDQLLRSIDIVIYCELSSIYYLDCAFLPYILRTFTQFFFLTPKPPYIPPMPKPAPYIGAIFGTNILCLILHVFLARPSADEVARGYLHGGLIIDFVGQKGPTSKLQLVALDILVLVLQLVMLAAQGERQSLKASLGSSSTGTRIEMNEITLPVQDHDAEERGVLRSDSVHVNDDIELQPLSSTGDDNPNNTTTPSITHHPPQSPFDPEEEQEAAAAAATDHPLDIFNSGQIIFTNLHLIDTIRNQWWAYERRAAHHHPEPSSTASPTTPSSSPTSTWRHGTRLGIPSSASMHV